MAGGGESIFNPGEVEASCGRWGRCSGGGATRDEMIFISDRGEKSSSLLAAVLAQPLRLVAAGGDVIRGETHNMVTMVTHVAEHTGNGSDDIYRKGLIRSEVAGLCVCVSSHC